MVRCTAAGRRGVIAPVEAITALPDQIDSIAALAGLAGLMFSRHDCAADICLLHDGAKAIGSVS